MNSQNPTQMDNDYIDLVERHVVAVIMEECEADNRFRRPADFARAAFKDEVSNHLHKWSRLRHGKSRLSLSDLVRASIVLEIDPALLMVQALNNMRKGKPLPESLGNITQD